MSFLFYFMIFSFFSLYESQIFDSELNVTSSLIEKLKAKNCIFVADAKDFTLINKIKYLAFSENVFVTWKSPGELAELIMSEDFLLFKETLIPALQSHKIVIVWKAGIDEINDVLKDVEIFGRLKQFDWIIILNEKNTSTENISRIKYGHYESNFLIVYPKGETFEIFEIYSVKINWKVFAKYYGTWTQETGLIATTDSIFLRRSNLEGSNLVLYTHQFLKHVFHVNPPIKNLYEFCTDLNIIMNFSFTNITMDQLTEVRSASHDAIDASLNLASWNWATSSRIYYNIVPLWKIRIFLHIKYETDANTSLQTLLKPFSTQIWLLLLLWLTISTVSVVASDYLMAKYFAKNNSSHFSMTDSLFAPLEALLNQGQHSFQSSSGKILFLSKMVKALILLPAYTGAVVSFLTITNPYFPFKDLKGFLEDGSYQIVGQGKAFLNYYFQQSNDTLSKIMYEKHLLKATVVHDLLDQLNATCQEKKFAFLGIDKEYLFPLQDKTQPFFCKILQIPEIIMATTAGMVTNYDSSLTSAFKHHWLRFQVYGIANKMKRRLNPPVYENTISENNLQSVKFGNIIPLLAIFATGILLAVASYFLEVIYYYLKKFCSKKSS